MFSRHYSLFSSTSENLKSIYKDSFLIDDSVIKTFGQPRNDYLFNSVKKN
ncbi:CDP-glycerol glycerophosphotransferase family protein [Photobacterium kishitanii]